MRINDPGETLFRQVLTSFGFDDRTVQDCWDERKGNTQRKFRRELRYYVDGLKALNIDPRTIDSFEKAEQAILKVVHWLHDVMGKSPSVVSDTVSTVGVMYGYKASLSKLSASKALRSAIKVMKRRKPKVRRELKLNWKLADLWRHFRSQGVPEDLVWDDLVCKCVCLARVFGRLRYTEIQQLDAEEREPTTEGWEFVVMLKGRVEATVITIARNEELALDPVQHLIELRERIRKKKRERVCMEETGFWMMEDGKKMGYDEIREAGARAMRAAGIEDNRSYHMKHAAITELQRLRVQPENIVAFARHRQGSTVWASSYLDSGNSLNSVEELLKLK
jgi:hypothetical protein